MIIFFIVCHSGPADHCAAFAKFLSENGIEVHIFAADPALQKFEEQGSVIDKVFQTEGLSRVEEEKLAEILAKECSPAHAVITDMGHSFACHMQKALAIEVPHVMRYAYYDNPEAFVPGTYSEMAYEIMEQANRVLFANAHLCHKKIFGKGREEILIPLNKRYAIGYYPLHFSEILKKKRELKQAELRAQFFQENGIIESGQNLLVYLGGNNEIFFKEALPSFLNFLESASEEIDLSNTIIVYQQHPGAKTKNLDLILIRDWQQRKAPISMPLLISQMPINDSLVVAEGALYYQTSMAPLLSLSGIPLMQVGYPAYIDLLVSNQLCLSASDSVSFIQAFSTLFVKKENDNKKMLDCLGYKMDWKDRLLNALKD